MNERVINESGNQYSELTVLEFSHINKQREACWKCFCNCGNNYTVSGKGLRSGRTTRCRKCAYKASHKTRANKGYKKTKRESMADINWYTLPNGYVNGFWPEHPLANKSSNNVFQHWVVWAEHYGIENAKHFLKEIHCTIHHRNGKRDDNRIKNLQLRFPGKHPKGWSEEVMINELKRLGYRVTKENDVK